MAKKISIPQFFFIFLLSIGISNHVLVVPLIIDAAGRDSWISVIAGYFLSIPFLFLLLSVTKQLKNKSILDWLETNYSNTLRNLIAVSFLIFFIITGFITVKEIVTWTNDTYLPYTPMIVVAFAIIAASLYISRKINVIGICAGILFPFVVAFLILVTVGNIPSNNYSLILPVLVENDWMDVLKASFFIFASTTEIFMLIMLQHHITKKVTFRHLFLLCFILLIATIGPLIGTIAIFGPEEAGKLNYPSFFQWRVLSIGQYFNHLDFFAIYQWLSATFIRLALILYLIKEVFNFRKPIIIQLIVCALYLLFMMIPISDGQFFVFLKDYFYLGMSIFAIAIISLISLLMKKSRNRVSANEK